MKRSGPPPVAIARQRAKYERLKVERTKLERGLTIEDTFGDTFRDGSDPMPWLRSISAQVIARRKLRRMQKEQSA
jgi:hypothetical protein